MYTGWLTAVGWQVYLASVCFLVGTIIQGLIALNDPNYPYLRWHGTLLAIAIVFFTISFNTVFASKLPLVGKFRSSQLSSIYTLRFLEISTKLTPSQQKEQPSQSTSQASSPSSSPSGPPPPGAPQPTPSSPSPTTAVGKAQA